MTDVQSMATWSAGLYDLGFAAFHIAFWRLFRWPQSLLASGQLNTAVTQTLNVVLTYVFVVAGVALIALAVKGGDAMFLAAACAGFWALRAALQPMLFEMQSKASQMMLVIFVAGALVHALAAGAGAFILGS